MVNWWLLGELGYFLMEGNVKLNGTKTEGIERFRWGVGKKVKPKREGKTSLRGC